MSVRRSKITPKGDCGCVIFCNAAAEEVEDVRERLPERLFATDQFLSERVNMYSAVDLLLWVRDVLDGTPKMSTLLGSCFGGLFQIHVCRLNSGKVVHNMMTRQLFEEVTELPCGEFEEGYSIAYQAPEEKNYD
ncbi:unnamed protein product [Brassica rapa]|uniref:Uncharacterized protein n=1 Tax=Brassica campestris TaxID=3711 RepID=A0A3P6BDM6_BRACM|nr:unnamed protein product [Brassica rapa]VDC97214.1 unnamed protein product [Brassica rapa]